MQQRKVAPDDRIGTSFTADSIAPIAKTVSPESRHCPYADSSVAFSISFRGSATDVRIPMGNPSRSLHAVSSRISMPKTPLSACRRSDPVRRPLPARRRRRSVGEDLFGRQLCASGEFLKNAALDFLYIRIYPHARHRYSGLPSIAPRSGIKGHWDATPIPYFTRIDLRISAFRCSDLQASTRATYFDLASDGIKEDCVEPASVVHTAMSPKHSPPVTRSATVFSARRQGMPTSAAPACAQRARQTIWGPASSGPTGASLAKSRAAGVNTRGRAGICKFGGQVRYQGTSVGLDVHARSVVGVDVDEVIGQVFGQRVVSGSEGDGRVA